MIEIESIAKELGVRAGNHQNPRLALLVYSVESLGECGQERSRHLILCSGRKGQNVYALLGRGTLNGAILCKLKAEHCILPSVDDSEDTIYSLME